MDAGSRAAHSIWLLSWHHRMGKQGGCNVRVTGPSSRVGLSFPGLLAWTQGILGGGEARAGETARPGVESDKKRGEGNRGGSSKAPDAWFRAETGGGAAAKTVWHSDGELLDLQLTVNTQTHIYTLFVHARPYAPKTFRHLLGLCRVLR